MFETIVGNGGLVEGAELFKLKFLGLTCVSWGACSGRVTQ